MKTTLFAIRFQKSTQKAANHSSSSKSSYLDVINSREECQLRLPVKRNGRKAKMAKGKGENGTMALFSWVSKDRTITITPVQCACSVMWSSQTLYFL